MKKYLFLVVLAIALSGCAGSDSDGNVFVEFHLPGGYQYFTIAFLGEGGDWVEDGFAGGPAIERNYTKTFDLPAGRYGVKLNAQNADDVWAGYGDLDFSINVGGVFLNKSQFTIGDENGNLYLRGSMVVSETEVFFSPLISDLGVKVLVDSGTILPNYILLALDSNSQSGDHWEMGRPNTSDKIDFVFYPDVAPGDYGLKLNFQDPDSQDWLNNEFKNWADVSVVFGDIIIPVISLNFSNDGANLVLNGNVSIAADGTVQFVPTS